MKTFALVSLFFCTLQDAEGQQGNLVRLRAGEDPNKAIPFSKRYKYDPFLKGHAYYSNGKTSASFKFNYDLLFGEMRIIKDPSMDTMSIVNDERLKYMVIGADLYFHDFRRGYMQVISETHSVRLAVQQLMKKKRRETAMSNGYASFVDYTSAVATPWGSDDLILELRNYYFFIDKDDYVWKANRGNLLRVLPQYQQLLELYLDGNHVNFRKDADIKRLFRYCNTLH